MFGFREDKNHNILIYKGAGGKVLAYAAKIRR